MQISVFQRFHHFQLCAINGELEIRELGASECVYKVESQRRYEQRGGRDPDVRMAWLAKEVQELQGLVNKQKSGSMSEYGQWPGTTAPGVDQSIVDERPDSRHRSQKKLPSSPSRSSGSASHTEIG